jgi:osmotically-inducible protein OsmY
MDDKQLRQEVTDELEFEPSIDAAHIGVGTRNRIVSLNLIAKGGVTGAELEALMGRVRSIKGVAANI